MLDTQRLVIPALGPIYRALAPFTEPLIRLVSGLSLAAHGYAILFGNHEAFAAFFERAGFRPGLFWAIANGIVQLGGGLCFAFGFLTRVVAVPILIFLVTGARLPLAIRFLLGRSGLRISAVLGGRDIAFPGAGRGPVVARCHDRT